MGVSQLLQPQRAARLVDQHRRDSQLPPLDEVLDTLVERTFAARPDGPREAALQEVVEQVVVEGLLRLAADGRATSAVRSRVEDRLLRLAGRLELETDSQRLALARGIGRHFQRALEPARGASPPADPPPGSPIGTVLEGLPDPGRCSLDG